MLARYLIQHLLITPNGMRKYVCLVCLLLITCYVAGQTFEITHTLESYKGMIGETVKAPLLIRNTSDKVLTLVIRKSNMQIGSTQISYFCLGHDCLSESAEDITLKLEPRENSNLLKIALDAGLAPGDSHLKLTILNKNNPLETHEVDLSFTIEEKRTTQVYTSPYIILYDVYPNPIADAGFIEFRILDNSKKAKILIHNILGNNFNEVSLTPPESKAKINAEHLSPGIYFYTLYLDNDAVVTRKLVIKK